jgi:VWFA-related protein
MILKKLLLLLIFIICFFSLALAQDKPKQDEGEAIRIDTELIQLDVIVTDKNGHIVDNLKQTDFELLEDGKAQDISFFSLVKPQINKSKPSISTSANNNKNSAIDVPLIESSGRTFIILVDDLHISPSSMVGVKKELFNLINSQIQGNDRVAVISTGGGLGFLQQLTDDHKVMRKAIERLRSQIRSVASPSDPARITEFQAQQILRNDRDATNLAVMRYIENTGINISRESAEREVKSTATQIVNALSFQTTATLQTIRNAILSVKSVPGRKTMILVTDGFLLEELESDHLSQMRRIIDAATRAGVVVYSLGSAGLQTSSSYDVEERSFDATGVGERLSSQSQTASLNAMKSIAKDTGGFSIINSNDLLGGLQNIVSESSSYYLLAYYPENNQKDGKFKEIKVNIKSNQNLIIKTRKGYFAGGEKLDLVALNKKVEKEKPEKEKLDDSVKLENKDLVDAIGTVIPVKDIKLKMKVDFLGDLGDKEKNNTIVSLAIDLRDINFPKVNNYYKNKVKSLLIVVGEDGKIAHSTENDVEMNFTETRYKQIGKSWFFFGKSLSLKPGFYSVRFAVKDPIDNKIGTSVGFVEVPNLEKAKLQVSNILLLHEEDSENTNSENITAKGQALSIFSEKSSVGFLCYIFSKENFKNNPQLTAQIQILQGNKALFTSQELNVTQKIDKAGRIVYGGKVPLTGFPAGQYQLKITISDTKNKAKAYQEQDFTIEKAIS